MPHDVTVRFAPSKALVVSRHMSGVPMAWFCEMMGTAGIAPSPHEPPYQGDAVPMFPPLQQYP